MAIRSLLPIFFLLGVCTAWLEERPMLETRNGNLVIVSAKDRNITLLTSGKSNVNINDINLIEVSENAQKAARFVQNWEEGYLHELTTVINRLITKVEGPHGLERRLNALQSGINTTSNSTIDGLARSVSVTRLTTRVQRVERLLRVMRVKLRRNECASAPCQNGGTCIGFYDGFQCLCPPTWEGPVCAVDVDECARFASTDLGCQNGATCRNLPGSYRCDCAPGNFGIHCMSKTSACDAQDSHELCGYGTCVPKKGSTLGYTCICDQGWTSEGSDPACRKDVDECAGKHPPCSMNPAVPCVNVAGGYACGGCPAGYTGNGYYCSDIDECSVDNGGCSTVPRVQCINTMGSRVCASCPPGYEGNGVTCTYVGSCRINNGGCHPLAICVENPGYTNLFVQCNCPVGYHGNGMGPQGCQPGADAISPCSSNPCVHGTCEPNGALFKCRCNPGFTGTQCESQVNPCTPNPCQNDGVCKSMDSRTVTCECTSNFSGPRCQTQRQSCGGLFRNPRGTLVYPPDGQNYEHGLNCAFVIITNRTSVLSINFTHFDIEPSHNCRYDFLQIHDGANAGAHTMGRFCGSSLPHGGTFTTTHNAVYLWLRSDSSVAHRGFTLHWDSVAPVCGGFLQGDHGTISSPGSPGRYPHNRDCEWEVMARPGKRIQFHFFAVMIEEHPTCEYDYLEINETIGNREVQLGLYCNHTHPAPLLTSGAFAKLHFHSDAAGSDMGFQITYSTVEGTPGCGGVFTTDHGIISTPGYPSNYPPRMSCEWKIQLPRGERMRLTWMTFDLEKHWRCRFDSVAVFSGPDPESPIVGRYCGDELPASVVLDSNVALIVFRSDWSNERKGFQLKYETLCGGEFHEPQGVIKSPFYPQSYPASRTCIYEIAQPPGKGIILTIVDMEIESGIGDSCYFDGLTIYDGDNENSTVLASLCGDAGSVPSQPYYSTHNFMYMKFVTDSSIHNRGFLANYTTVNRRCGGLLKAPTGIIQSHTEGSTYGNDEDCTWTLKAPKGHIVQLTFTTFSLEGGTRCSSDYVAIYDGANVESQEMGRYCGSVKPPALMTQGESMTIVFHTDSGVTEEGFIAHYLFIDASKVCGGRYVTPTGTITSPNYPERYPANRECVWVITAPNKQQVNLEIEEFDLERLSSCNFDYLEIRNGGYEDSPLIGKYCGTTIPRKIKSLTNQLYLKFVSDSSRQMGGFSIKWDSSTFGCGGTLTGYKGEITSPNYPQPYARLTNCVWKIAVTSGSHLRLIIVDLDLEDHGRCRYDFIEVTTGVEEYRRTGTRYCGTNHPSFIDVDSNLATIRFRSDYTNAGRGFRIRYETNCVTKIHGFNGVIESPNFPNKYPGSLNCTWTIEASIGNTVNVTFSHFELEGPSVSKGCSYDYLAIKEGENDEANSELATLCGSSGLPARISSTQHQLFVHFVTDQYFASDGFRLEWSSVGCGGQLTRPSGTITSPGYPNAYPENIECEWLIEVDHGNSVEITLLDVNTEKMSGCTYDKVTLYGGADASAPLLTELCHTDGIVKYTSPTNKLFVKFKADFSFAGRGFKAEYKSVGLSCGGNFRANEGVIHSKNYPLNYPNNANCEWLIQVDKSHVINITFTDFDIEDTTNCTDDYVKVFDGATRDAVVLGTFCKSDLPPPIVSTGDSMLVVMRSDSLVTSKGFNAKFMKACGARLVTNSSGTLETSSLLHMADFGVNCTWIVVSEDAADHVTLNFFHMDLANSYGWDDDCSSHYVRVYEGDGTDGPVRGTWCSNKTPPPITSTGNALTIHLYAEYGTATDGFGATYSVLDSACGGEHLSASGTIASPTYPDSYPTNAECVWLLKTSPGNRISLTFTAFDVENSPNCDRDYLEIREDSGIGNLIGIYCTDATPAPIESSKKLWIKFRSDESGTARGFLAEYTFVHGNELTGMNGEIASPLYPYPWKQEGETTWRITVGFGMAIRVEYDDVHMENFGDCSSSVTIYDGYDSDAPELSNACGLSPPGESITSSSNVAFIRFTGSFFREGNWFHLHWYQVPRDQTETGNTVTRFSDCVVEYDMTSIENRTVTFESPGYPDGYDHNLDCTWLFTSPPGYHFVLRFTAMDLEESWNCASDYVSVYNGNGLSATLDDSQILRRACWRNETYRDIVGKSVMTVKFKSDFYINGTGFRATVRRDCGGEISGPNGVIDFNKTKSMLNPFTHRYICEWNITVKTGRTIEVDFTSFSAVVSEGNACDNNYVLMKNGDGPESPLLGVGKICGSNTLPGTLETTGNKLYLKAVGLQNQINFKMTYREKSMACGGSFTLTKGESGLQTLFMTPNYPNIPPPYTECFWTYLAPAGERLSLHFLERFDLTSSPNCTSEYVEVRDGGTEHSQLLGTYCGSTAPSSMTTTGSMIYIHFYTEMADPKNGFKATITTGEVCGGIIRSKTGVVRSPNYPNTYPIDQECGWWIIGPVDHTLKLEFTDIHLPGLRRCENTDNVVINERQPANATTSELMRMVNPLGRWCGTTKPPPIETSSNEAIIAFTSDNRTGINYRGFSLNFTASKEACGGSLTGVSGEFQSIGYPNPSKRSRHCEWLIEVPEGSHVKLEILDLDVTDDEPEGAFGIFLVLYNDRSSRAVIRVVRKSPYPDAIFSTTNIMKINFWFNSARRGMKARFTAVAPAPCGGVVNDVEGDFLPPFRPYDTVSYYCEWKVRLPETMFDPHNRTGTTLTITVSGNLGNFDRSRVCKTRLQKQKYIEMNDGEHIYGEVCGKNRTNEPYVARSPATYSVIKAMNGSQPGSMNFEMHYKWTACGGILTGPSHTISSPLNVAYPRSCAWHVKFDDPDAVVFMTFDRMNLGSCDKGYITVKNGRAMSPEIGKFCGNIKPHNITSSRNELWIEYWAAEAPGDFQFQINSPSGSCGGVFQGANKQITSPGFPKSYPNNAECTWEITPDPGYRVGLVFVDRFSIETSNDCTNDFVQMSEWVYDNHGIGAWKDGPKYCGRNTPTPYNSTSNRVKMLFRSNNAVQGDGFRAIWEQNCGGIFEATGQVQYIATPFYPDEYPFNSVCNYTITAPSNKEIWVEFLDFELEDRPGDCKYDNVTISRYTYYDHEAVWCGNRIPPITNAVKKISILFRTDRYIQKRGFKLKYFLNECGGEITEPTQISPPSKKTGEYFGRLNCTWVIRAPEGKSVVLRFEKFHLEWSSRCHWDKVLVVEGETLEGGTQLAKLCGNATDPLPPPVKSAGRVMTVMFESDGSNEYGGMKAAIIFANSVASGCGGKIDLQQSRTFSTQRGALYEPLEDCHWTVTVKPEKNVRFTINRIDLKNSTNSTHADGRCSGDFLEVRDGGPFGEIIGQYCGNLVPHPVTSSLNVLSIRLFTDSTLEGEGVSATLDPIDSPCGKNIYEMGNETEIVKSPGYPADFPAGIQCRWIFKNLDQYSTLRLHLETLDMEDTENCDGDYLEMSDEIGKYILQDFGEDFIFNGRKTRQRSYSRGRYHRSSSYKYCGQASAIDYYSNSNEIHVALRSTANHLPKPRKFMFDVAQASCNRNYTAEQGRIMHRDVGECWTTITAPTNRTISLYFKHFRFYDHGNCSVNSVQVHDGDFKSPVLQTLCGLTEPSPIFTSGNVLSLHAKSSAMSFGAESYDILYTTTDKGRGCGGKLFNYEGIFTSPMYPNNYRNGSTCEWEISVPRGYKVALVFDFFDLGTSDICPTDYLVVKELNKDDGREETYCPGQIPAPFRATTNTVRVTYVSSVNNGGTGWVIRFAALQGTEPVESNYPSWRRMPVRIAYRIDLV